MCQLLALLALFLLVPIAELYVLIRIGAAVGPGPTLVLVLATALLGASLARRQGLAALRRIQEASDAGRVPADELLDGALILVAGVVLLTPGILTDVLGFLVLVPPLRRRLRRWLAGHFARASREGRAGFARIRFGPEPPVRGGVRDVEHEDVDRKPLE